VTLTSFRLEIRYDFLSEGHGPDIFYNRVITIAFTVRRLISVPGKLCTDLDNLTKRYC